MTNLSESFRASTRKLLERRRLDKKESSQSSSSSLPRITKSPSSSTLETFNDSCSSFTSSSSTGSLVSFHEKVTVRKIPGRQHMTKGYMKNAYWNRNELKQIRHDAIGVVQSALEDDPSSPDDLVGLEKHLPENALERKLRRQAAIRAVLHEQAMRSNAGADSSSSR